MLCTLSIVCHTGYMMRVQYIAQASAVSEPAVSTNTKKKQAPHVVENGPMMDAASTETKTICCTVQVPGSFIHVGWVTHSMLVVEQALFHYHLYSQFTSCFSRELK